MSDLAREKFFGVHCHTFFAMSSVSAAMGSLSMRGSVRGGSLPEVISSKEEGGKPGMQRGASSLHLLHDLQCLLLCWSDKDPLLVAEFELHPLDSKYNQRVKVSLRPIQVIYDKDTVDEVISMFKPPRAVRLQKLSSGATATLNQLKTQTRAGLEHSISTRTLIDIDVTLSSPVLVIPEDGILSEDASKLVLDLGTLRVTSDIKHIVPDVKVGEKILVCSLSTFL